MFAHTSLYVLEFKMIFLELSPTVNAAKPHLQFSLTPQEGSLPP